VNKTVNLYARKAYNTIRSRIQGRHRLWLIVSVAALFLFALLAAVMHDSRETTVVQNGELVTTIPVSGTLKAVDADFLGPPVVVGTWNFKIAWMAPEGAVAKKGSTVLRFDTSDLHHKLKGKRTESAEAAKQIEKKEAEIKLKEEDGKLKEDEAAANLKKIETSLKVPPELKSSNDLKKTRLDLMAAT